MSRRSNFKIIPLCVIFLIVSLVGCGGESSNSTPTYSIEFIHPIEGSNTGLSQDHQNSVVIRIHDDGNADSNFENVRQVSANDLALEQDPDDPGLWRGWLDVRPGKNTLAVKLEAAGNSEAFSQIHFNNNLPINSATDLLFDELSQRLYFAENYTNQIYWLELESGAIYQLTGENSESPPMENIYALDWIEPGRRLLTIETSQSELVIVDLTTGDQQKLKFVNDLGENLLSSPRYFSRSDTSGLVYVVDSDFNSIFELNLQTQESRIVSSVDVGTGVGFSDRLRGIVVNDDLGVLYLSDFGDQKILQIDIVTGERTVIAAVEDGLGPDIGSARELNLDRENNRLIVGAYYDQTLFEIGLQGFNRNLLFDMGSATSDSKLRPFCFSKGVANSSLFIADYSGGLYQLQLDTNEFNVLQRFTVGSGATFGVKEIFKSPNSDEVAIFDVFTDSISWLNLRTGNREVVFDLNDSDVENISNIEEVAFDWQDMTLYFYGRQSVELVNRIYRYNISSGETELLAESPEDYFEYASFTDLGQMLYSNLNRSAVVDDLYFGLQWISNDLDSVDSDIRVGQDFNKLSLAWNSPTLVAMNTVGDREYRGEITTRYGSIQRYEILTGAQYGPLIEVDLPEMFHPFSIVESPEDGRLFVSGFYEYEEGDRIGAIFLVKFNGEMTEVSGPNKGFGIPLKYRYQLPFQYDKKNDRIIVAVQSEGIRSMLVSVDVASGNRVSIAF